MLKVYQVLLDLYYRLLNNLNNLVKIHVVSYTVHQDVHDVHND
jgi:hypothetical protein